VLLVGEGPWRSRLERLAAQLGIAGRVEFRGELPHNRVPAALAEMDVFAIPSRAEGFGVAALEASAMALPVIGSRVHGIPDVVQDGQTGLLVPPGDVEALAATIERLAGDAGLRRTMGEAGRAFVEERYRWEENAALMERIYRHVLEPSAYDGGRATVR
jgi:glycosyltransferase involved in cell wall biosynthesis